MSTQVVRVQSFSKGSLKNIGNEVDRAKVDHRNPDIDQELSHLNHSYKDATNGMYAEWNNVLKQLNVAETRIRKDTTAFEGVVVTSDKEFFEKLGWVKGEPAPKAVQEFFDRAYDFSKKQFGYQGTDKNFLSAKVHYDETTPHLQLYYAPITAEWKEKVYLRDAAGHVVKNDNGVPQQEKGADGKALFKEVKNPEQPRLNRSEFWRVRGGKASYRKMQDIFHETVGKAYELERGEIGSDREHQTKTQWETKQLLAEKEKIEAEHKQLASEVTQYRDMKVAVDQVDLAEQPLPLGRVVVKKSDLDKLAEQARAYAVHRDRLRHIDTIEQSLNAKENALLNRELEIGELEESTRKMYFKQKGLNESHRELTRTVKRQTGEIAQLQETNEQQSADYAKIREAYCRTVQAAGMLLWDDETGYKVELPQKAEALIAAINKRAEMDFVEIGDKENAKNVREFIGIDKRIENLMSAQREPDAQNRIRNQKQEELFVSVLEDSPVKIEKALESGAEVATFFDDESALHIAVQEHKYRAAEKLLEIGVCPDALDRKLKTPLYDAVMQNDTKMAGMLLDHGATPSLRVGDKCINEMAKSKEMDELFINHEKGLQRTRRNSSPHISR